MLKFVIIRGQFSFFLCLSRSRALSRSLTVTCIFVVVANEPCRDIKSVDSKHDSAMRYLRCMKEYFGYEMREEHSAHRECWECSRCCAAAAACLQEDTKPCFKIKSILPRAAMLYQKPMPTIMQFMCVCVCVPPTHASHSPFMPDIWIFASKFALNEANPWTFTDKHDAFFCSDTHIRKVRRVKIRRLRRWTRRLSHWYFVVFTCSFIAWYSTIFTSCSESTRAVGQKVQTL